MIKLGSLRSPQSLWEDIFTVLRSGRQVYLEITRAAWKMLGLYLDYTPELMLRELNEHPNFRGVYHPTIDRIIDNYNLPILGEPITLNWLRLDGLVQLEPAQA